MSSQDQTTIGQGAGDRVRSLQTRSVFETLESDVSCQDFLAAVREGGMSGLLKGPEWVTVFVPKGGPVKGDVGRFVSKGRLLIADMREEGVIRTLDGKTVPFKREGGKASFGDAEIVQSDIPCTNGVIHILDQAA